jgi:ubiquinone/menaquinone biosynthesis C-methylase UbiE
MHTEGFAHPARNVGEFRIETGMIVADFGAGSGAYALAMAQVLAGNGTVYAIDIQQDLVRRIHNDAKKREIHGVEIVWGDIEKKGGTKIKEESVDRVLISNVLFQVDDKRAVFREAQRILKPNGLVIVIDWTDSFRGMGPHKDHVVTKAQMIGYAKQELFTVEHEFAAGEHHYGVILKSR